MAPRNDFESRRLDNIKRNQEVLQEIGVISQAKKINNAIEKEASKAPAVKRRKIERIPTQPSRTSARIAAAPEVPTYNEDSLTSNTTKSKVSRRPKSKSSKRASQKLIKTEEESESEDLDGPAIQDLDALKASWTSWIPTAGPPTRDDHNVFHFPSHPTFTPNKSPSEMLREGAFGGSYFRPLYSKKLRTTITDDYLELPSEWIEGLDVNRYLISPEYNAEANKFQVACGQSIEEWEAAGWIEHRFDVRGWFQWYCRFFMGRRCEDDERQVGRWRKCVGETGRWRRMLLKKYVGMGVREVWDDGEEEESREVSPVMHQTCHHWAFEVTQEVLDDFWRTGR